MTGLLGWLILCGVLWKLHRHPRDEKGRGDHEDHEQNKHDIDHRRDIDFRHDLCL